MKKFAPKKKMKCDNNSIYKLQDRVYMASTGYPSDQLYDFFDDIFLNFENSLQWINYFPFFTFFNEKIFFLQSQQKNNYTVNIVIKMSAKSEETTWSVYLIRRLRYSKKTDSNKKNGKHIEKNFDLVLLKKHIFLFFYFSTEW